MQGPGTVNKTILDHGLLGNFGALEKSHQAVWPTSVLFTTLCILVLVWVNRHDCWSVHACARFLNVLCITKMTDWLYSEIKTQLQCRCLLDSSCCWGKIVWSLWAVSLLIIKFLLQFPFGRHCEHTFIFCQRMSYNLRKWHCSFPVSYFLLLLQIHDFMRSLKLPQNTKQVHC